jgi:glutamyl-tRNA synthetase
MTPVLRFAPSPTGRLHLGNARAALVNWLFARHHGGRLILRLDDTDALRSTKAFAAAIEEDLAWLGIDWDARHRQSERGASYAAALARLQASGHVYPAYETAHELEAKRAAQRAKGLPPVYDRAALALTAAERAAFEAQGRTPHWRLRLSGQAAHWTDLVQGEVAIPAGSLSDPVLARADGGWTYTLASVVDDAEMGVTHIVRGDDHRTNTAVQLELFRSLGAEPPAMAHLPLITGPGGAPLAKRSGAWSLADYRLQGIEPHAIRLVLAALGTDRQLPPETTVAMLIDGFDLARFGRTSAVFDDEQLARTSAAVFQVLPFAEARKRDGLADLAEGEWHCLRQNARHPADLLAWRRVVREPLTPIVEDAGFLDAAASLLPERLDDAAAATAWLDAVKKATGRKGRALFHPIRLALTGRDDGPKLADLLPLLGRERIRRRLSGETA